MSGGDTADRIRRLLETEGEAVKRSTTTFNQGRYQRLAELEHHEQLRDRTRAIKESAIEHLPELLDQVTESVETNGGSVHLAADATDAHRVVHEIVDMYDAEVAVKSKSMTTEEIGLNDALEGAGVEVWETDLGEFIIQLADESPSHITAPAIHHSQEEIAALFAERFDLEEPLTDAAALTRFARSFLTERIKEADIGITGANFIAADSGTIVLVTSEGNARKCVALPPVHIAIAGIEKIIPSIADLDPFIQLLARSATGQDLSAYLSLFTPPVDTPVPTFEQPETPIEELSDERSFHLILLDNGRWDLRADTDLKETLYCIRCSACANSCANFQHVGGHAFGGETYSGGIATGWETGVHGIDSAAQFTDLCTGCTRCVPNCPVKIDIPWINTVVRDRLNRAPADGRFDAIYRGLRPTSEAEGISIQRRAIANVDRLLRWASLTAPVSTSLTETRPVRLLAEHFFGIDRRRTLPQVTGRRFSRWAADRESVQAPRRSVVIYPDIYTEYVRPERGKAAVTLLESLGIAVEVAPVVESGRAPLSQGMVKQARTRAAQTLDSLRPSLGADSDVVVIEPSELGMFRREYSRLLGDESSALAERSYELFEYLFDVCEAYDTSIETEANGHAIYHPHCQARTLGIETYTTSILEMAGLDVQTTTAECCGMAGSFGFKTQYYDLSMAIGESLAEEVEGAEEAVVLASGTSCLDQLTAVTDTEPIHPAVWLAKQR